MNTMRPITKIRAAKGTVVSVCSAVLAVVCLARPASAIPPDSPEDRFALDAHATTYVRYFDRALLPGPGGALAPTDSMLPVYEYLSLRASDIDAPWARDSIDVELSAWGSLELEKVDGERRLDGDLSAANVRYRLGPSYIKVGRQNFAGGAARFSAFDGLSAGTRSDLGLGIDAYAGYTVLPRWSQQPRYQYLGTASDSILRSPDALPPPNRAGYWLAGARSSYSSGRLGEIGVSFHEQHEQFELGRRNAGADARLSPVDWVDLTGLALMDLDGARIADAHVAFDFYPTKTVSATTEYQHAVPALLLSQQSLFSVFATSAFDEVGGEARYRPVPALLFGGAVYSEFFGSGEHGVRTHWRLRASPDRSDRLVVQVVYGRVVEPVNGYHSARVSLSYRVATPLALTAEHYAYFYDEPIRGIPTSSVEVATVEWTATRSLRLMLGTSVTQSPYARLDTQTLLRGAYEFDSPPRGHR
jgi:hypothetical protein